MPMIDLTMPSGTFTGDSKAELMETLTRTLLKWEGAKPGNKAAESIAWTFLHESALVTVAGRPTQQPRYRVVVGVPQGTLDGDAKAGLVAEVTEQILRAEMNGQAPAPEDSFRVWVIINEITDGNWGGGGRIFRLTDILTFAGAGEKEIERRMALLRQSAV
ncbi:tautomerase family protein [Actinomadura sp. HBU206391]|uniref:tautomerase family protein n=1 Tax=Actinomadura sp. HBU206391 TaxID=2731692 RepID=UPI00164F091E|nr:4-oxalocrotonate tautomerase [Actinomadura sp. HBU206391]MBC6461990.1 4-oxalocrotonate tautomerase [Actinomadura sp. HBU206391]